ncbi:MAG TPA: immunoglobulin domain-containing protein, partial [Lacunisphaera sp.]|nr:immunoglobulin domain-containing protein [Lacunisphaera sp.]
MLTAIGAFAAPQVTLQPADQIATEYLPPYFGTDVTFTVAATGTAPVSYQWQIQQGGTGAWTAVVDGTDPVDGTNYIGSQADVLEVYHATYADDNGDKFRCVVTDSEGTTTSGAALLTVVRPQYPPGILSADSVASGSSYTAAASVGFGAVEWALGTGSTAAGASIDASTGTITYTGLGTVVIRARFSGDANHLPSDYSAGFVVTVHADSPPDVTDAPAGRIVGTVGQPLSLTVTAETIFPPLSYQWKKNNRVLPSATSATYSIPSFANADAGAYTLEVSDSRGAVTRVTTHVIPNYGHTQVIAWGGQNTGGEITVPGDLADDVVGLAAGGGTSYAIRADGTIRSWGSGSPPAGLSEIVSIAGGLGSHSIALKSDGTVVEWGGEVTAGNIVTPVGLRNVIAVGAGGGFSVALKADGTVQAWGANTSGATDVPAGLSDVVLIAAGYNHVIALRGNGAVVGWGGDGQAEAAAPVGFDVSDASSLSAGVGVSAAIKANGTLVRWGTSPLYLAPDDLGTLAAFSYGQLHHLALRTNGTARVWGLNNVGQTNMPGVLNRVYAIATGNSHSLVLRDDTGDVAPAITADPASQTVSTGANVTFSVAATGDPAPVYQWKKDGVSINGATSSSYTVSGVSAASAGSYTVVATNYLGSATSAPGVLVVHADQPAPVISSAASISFGASYTATANTGYGALEWALGAGSTASGAAINATTGIVSYTGVGTVKIKARFAGDAGHDPSAYSAEFTVTVNKATISLALGNLSPTYNGTAQVVVATQQAEVTTIAGRAPLGNEDGPVASARFFNPTDVAIDGSGVLYVADSGNRTIRKIGVDGIVSTLAGSAGNAGVVDGTGSAARFNAPRGIVIDASGNLYVTDTGVHAIRKITPAGAVSTFVGDPTASGTNDGTGNAARFGFPTGIAIDGAGNLFVTDSNTIRKISPTAVVTTLAGSPGTAGSVDGTGSAARFSNAKGLALDGAGNLFVADGTTVRKVTAAGVVSTVAGTAGQSGTADGVGTAARFEQPYDIAVDSAGNVYVADQNGTIRKIASDGTVTTLAGMASLGSSASTDGTGAAARIYGPNGLAIDGSNQIFVAEVFAHKIRKVSPAGVVTTVAGAVGAGAGATDGMGEAARFWAPRGIAVDGAGNQYVADMDNEAIRKIEPTGEVTTLAGLAGVSGPDDGTGSSARFLLPTGVAVDSAGTVYVTDAGNALIRRISPAGVVDTLAGSLYLYGHADGSGTSAKFYLPWGLGGFDSGGNIYVADTTNRVVRKVTPAGVVTTLAGSPGVTGSADGLGASARFATPRAVAVDSGGNVFVADTTNHTIRKVFPNGLVTTFAGSTLGPAGLVDGPLASARFSGPDGIAFDAAGNCFVVDSSDRAVRKISTDGMVTTIAGGRGIGSSDGPGSVALFHTPAGIAADGAGTLYVADTGNHTIRKITGTGGTITVTYDGSSTPPTAPGSYAVVATLNDPNLQGTASGTLVINPISQAAPVVNSGHSVMLGDPYTATAPAGIGALQWALGTGSTASDAAIDASTGALTASSVGTVVIKARYAADATHAASDYSADFVVTVSPFVPVAVITSRPLSRIAREGDAVSFTVGALHATGYTWKRNRQVIAGATGATLNLASVTAADRGYYEVIVSGTAGDARSVFYLDVAIPGMSVVAWGSNYLGSMNAPGDLTDVVTIASQQSSLALKADGTLVAWGSNLYGQTGLPAGLASVVGIAVGSGVSAAVKSDGTLALWGSSGTGALDIPAGLNEVVAVKLGSSHVLALRADGTVIAWGSNNFGQSDVPAGLSDVVAIATSGSHNLALKSDGTVVAWGWNFYGQTNVPAGLSNVVQVSAGTYQSLVLKADGTVAGWGYNVSVGTIPPGLGSVIAIDADTWNLALKSDGTVVQWGAPGFDAIPGGLHGTVKITAGYSHGIVLAPVTLAPEISTPLLDQVASLGTVTGFYVAAGGTPPLTYQWRKGGANLTNGSGVSGVNESRLQISNFQAANAGSYDVVVTGSAGTVTSNAATLTVATTFALSATSFTYTGSAQGPTLVVNPGSATYTTAGTLSATNVGTYLATATATGSYSGNNYYLIWTIAKATQAAPVISSAASITFDSSYTATANTGIGNLEWALGTGSTASGAAIDAATGVVTYAGAGTVKIKARFAGDTNHDASGYCADFTVTISKATVSLTLGGLDATYDGNPQSAWAAQGAIVTTVAGKAATGSADGVGAAAQFRAPSDVAVDAAGVLYVADSGNNTIRKIATDGTVTTFAGSPGLSAVVDGTGSAARFRSPRALTIDGAGNLYVVGGDLAVRKITPAGEVTTLAGDPASPGTADGTGSAARFLSPGAVALDSSGNLYVADFHAIRKVTPAGVVTTLAGVVDAYGSADGVGSAARFYQPRGLVADGDGNVYVSDTFNNTVRKVTPGGNVTTFAGLAGFGGGTSTDGVGSAARFRLPRGIVLDGSGNLYVADYFNNTLRKITPAGEVTTIVSQAGYGNYGVTDGTGSAARLHGPAGLAIDGAGNLFVAQLGGHTIRKVTPAAEVTTIAGAAGIGTTDGPVDTARFDSPTGVARDAAGNLYVADTGNFAIRKISPAGNVTALVGVPGPGNTGSADGVGSAAGIGQCFDLATDASGVVYFADAGSRRIRKVTADGTVTTLAGSISLPTYADGAGMDARFNSPNALTDFDGAGNMYVLDSDNALIRKVTLAGVVTTMAGTLGTYGWVDGPPGTARINFGARGLAVDPAGNVYVADTSNRAIRKVAPNGMMTTVAGSPAVPAGLVDGPVATARFTAPFDVAVDAQGNLFVSDSQAIRKISTAGIVTTIAGSDVGGSKDGVGSEAQFNGPASLMVDSTGAIHLADSNNATIRRITGINGAVTFTYDGSSTPPTAPGSYTVVATVNEPGFQGSASGTLVIGKANPSAPVISSPASTTFGSSYTAAANSGNGALDWALGSGSSASGAGIDASTGAISYTSVGTVVIKVRSAGDANHNASAYSSDFTVTVVPQPVSFALGATSFTYNGSAQGPSVVPTPGNATFTPGGTLSATNAGTYTATATATGNYTGSSNSLTWSIAKATAAMSLGGLTATYDGFAHEALSGPLGVVTTYAGVPGSPGSLDGTGLAALFNYPQDVAVDPAGNIYVTDSNNRTIRKITSAGVVSTFAGAALQAGTSDGTGSAARFYNLKGIAIDGNGNLYVADDGNHTIRKITPTGVVTTFAGLAQQPGATDGTGGAARFSGPEGIAVDAAGNVYVSETGNQTIRKITPAGVVTTIAGSPGNSGSADGTGSAARFNVPRGLAVDTAGNLYVADCFNSTIRKVTSAGVVTTIAGQAGLTGSADGVGTAARFQFPSGVTVDGSGNVYVADFNCIRKITPDGTVTTLAGNPNAWWDSVDGTGLAARFRSPRGLEVDSAGNIFVADNQNHQVRKVTAAGMVTTLAGTPPSEGSTDGPVANARFSRPSGAAFDATGNLYIAEYANNTLRKITPAGIVSTLAGTAGALGSADGTGGAARFARPTGVAVDGSGNVYVAEEYNHTIRKVTAAGVVTTLAGSPGLSGSADGTGAAARFDHPGGLAVDGAGNVYVADQANFTLRKITPGGVVTTFAGSAGLPGSADGAGGAARFSGILGLAADGTHLYATDGGVRVRKIALADATVTTIAGGVRGTDDGVGAAARFSGAFGIAVSASGYLYVTEVDEVSRIRIITPNGTVTTLAGSSQSAEIDGIGTDARFYYPEGIAINGAGDLFVTDFFGNTIRKVSGDGAVNVTYDGSSTVPTAAGSYSVVATLTHANYQGTATGTLVIAPAGQAAPVISSASSVTFGSSYTATANTGYGALEWALGSGSTASGAAINASSGAVSFASVGTVVIKARFAGDTNHSASAYSSDFVVTVLGPPVITGQSPTRVVLAPGNSLNLTISGTGAASFQWFHNGQPIAGATTSGFAIPATQFADSGWYLVEVSNAVGTTRSAPMFVLVAPMATEVRGWGSNFSGELDALVGLAGVIAVDIGGAHRLGLKRDGTVIGWGSNSNQQIAIPAGLDNVVAVAAGGNHSLALKSDGTVVAWGLNTSGQATVPAGLTNAVAIAATGDQSWALKRDGTVALWGNFNAHTTVIPSDLTNIGAIAASDAIALFLKTDGTVVAWGGGSVPSGLSGVTSVSAGTNFAMALKGDGTVVAWGGNTSGESTVPSGLANVTAISAGYSTAFAVKGDGTVVTWGSTFSGIRDVPADLANVFAVSGGAFHAVAIRDATGDTAPVITTHPASQTKSAGQTVQFSVTASGAPAPTYQWQMGTGSTWQNIAEGDPYAGTNTAALSIAGWATSALNGIQFRCVVSNAGGSTTSNAAVLTVRAARGDFNGDGKSDILWRHAIGGNVVFWLMNGTRPQTVAEVTPVSTDWVISGTGDFNGDGQTDIVWRHKIGGNVVFWLMNGNRPQTVAEVTPVPTEWVITGTGEFNGDGQTDIVWRHNTGGNIVFWFMNGTSPASAVEITPVSTDWVITTTGDFNNDGKTDIVWRHSVGGNIVFWMMNGSSVQSS